MQGAFAGLTSVASVVGLPLGAWSFSWAVEPGSPVPLGIAFFEGAALMALALALAVRSFRRDATTGPAEVNPRAPA